MPVTTIWIPEMNLSNSFPTTIKDIHPAYPPHFNATTSSWSDFLSMKAAVTQSWPASDSWPAYWKHSVTLQTATLATSSNPKSLSLSLLLPKCEYKTNISTEGCVFSHLWWCTVEDESPSIRPSDPYLMYESMWKCCVSSAVK